MIIDSRKSYFWHWFVMLSLPHRIERSSVYFLPKIAKHDDPFEPISTPQAGIFNRWQLSLLLRERIRRNKHCKVYRYQQ